MKKAVLVMLFLAPFVAVSSVQGQSASHAGHHSAVQQAAAQAQNVKLSTGDGGYVVTPTTVTKGVPVKMEVDLDKVKGCARTVVITAFGVKKTVKTDDNVIEFTPDKTGPIEIVCGMNMVKGSFTVGDAK